MSGVAALARTMAAEWRDDRITGLAAEVAFFGLLSVFPMLLAVAAILGSLDSLVGDDLAEDARAEVVGWASRLLTDDGETVRDGIDALFTEQRPGLVTGAAVAAVWSASRGFHALLDALRVVYDIDDRGPWVRRRALAVALALASTLLGAAVLAAVVAGPLLGSGRDVADAVGAGDAFVAAWDVLRWPVVVAAAVAWCATIMHVAREHRTPWRADLPGAALAAAWALAATVGLRLYLAVAAGSNPVLGTLGGSIVVVLWLYLLAVGVLVGGELNTALVRRRRVAASLAGPEGAAG